MKKVLLELVASFLLGLGCLASLSPFFFYWLIHGSDERYLWIISGPPPFDSFGGGPFQVVYLMILPFVLGAVLIGISLLIKRLLSNAEARNRL